MALVGQLSQSIDRGTLSGDWGWAEKLLAVGPDRGGQVGAGVGQPRSPRLRRCTHRWWSPTVPADGVLHPDVKPSYGQLDSVWFYPCPVDSFIST